jgi:anti-sigma regulatory factor (Ser/Thr protein kinase)
VTLEQQFDQGTLHALRETVLAHAVASGMAGDRAIDVMLAAHELAANAVCHGGGAGQVQMLVTSGELVLQVSDPGPAGRGDHAAESWPYQPGHGLWLVRQVADRVTAVSGPAGSHVTVAFALVPGVVPEGG